MSERCVWVVESLDYKQAWEPKPNRWFLTEKAASESAKEHSIGGPIYRAVKYIPAKDSE